MGREMDGIGGDGREGGVEERKMREVEREWEWERRNVDWEGMNGNS